MKALLQRVSRASVEVDAKPVGSIDTGLLVLLGLEQGDSLANGRRLLDKLLDYRVFPDAQERMNLSVRDVSGGVLLVSQFTLAASTRKGLRPSFSAAMPPAEAEVLYVQLLDLLRELHPVVSAGVFGADMQVSLTNDGPVTFLLEVAPD
ncbi:D-tyrosyl-tRNA(Tyr) deacylase [Halieaceae bacterium IMCC14734]|uniref:D-aminoacyl-tRNA deacylase n=1 Tax=Candidatus Litorirhabdus singularis TaxID=2518993 RepID=A0ABT3TC18_9GAMM|nr:D-aminoacyl-tRNA deacylase [Candidatus Litorirhabdus singularis]MCX2979825.1 D-tyrosyl-tRNA(Tyr) deacylase [Candidatus Litorirhabdus singularis]